MTEFVRSKVLGEMGHWHRQATPLAIIKAVRRQRVRAHRIGAPSVVHDR